MAVRPDADEDEVERPASPASSMGTAARISAAYVGRAPGRSARLADRLRDREGVDVIGRQRHALVPAALDVDARRARAGLARERGTGEQPLVDEDDVRQRMVARDVAVVAEPDVDASHGTDSRSGDVARWR